MLQFPINCVLNKKCELNEAGVFSLYSSNIKIKIKTPAIARSIDTLRQG